MRRGVRNGGNCYGKPPGNPCIRAVNPVSTVSDQSAHLYLKSPLQYDIIQINEGSFSKHK